MTEILLHLHQARVCLGKLWHCLQTIQHWYIMLSLSRRPAQAAHFITDSFSVLQNPHLKTLVSTNMHLQLTDRSVEGAVLSVPTNTTWTCILHLFSKWGISKFNILWTWPIIRLLGDIRIFSRQILFDIIKFLGNIEGSRFMRPAMWKC